MHRRMSLPLAAVLLAVPLTAAPVAAVASHRLPTTYTLPGDNVFPEGIAADNRSGDFFVSATGGGAIYKGDEDSRRTRVWLPAGSNGRVAATGMELSADGRTLFVSGAATGSMFVYDTRTKKLLAKRTTSHTPAFINDVTVVRGDAYFTDSFHPKIYRVSRENGRFALDDDWLTLGAPYVHQKDAFNLNGIVGTGDGKHLITIQTVTGKLFLVDIAGKRLREIDTGDADLKNGDGLVLKGSTLWVIRNQQEELVELSLSRDMTSADVVSTLKDGDPGRWATPTTGKILHGRLLVVNSQFAAQGTPAGPKLPFTVTALRTP